MTISCAFQVEDRFRCPTKWELWRQLMKMLPRGRAWQTHDGAPEMDWIEVEGAGTGGGGAPPPLIWAERLTPMQRYWAAYAAVLEYLHQRACALIEEFFCVTTTEMEMEWAREYGYPDDCEPYDTLCDKVRAQGGATCAYLAGLAARLGYAIECVDCEPGGAEALCLEAGCTVICGPCDVNTITIRIITAASPAYQAQTPFEAGSIEPGCTPPCPPAPEIVVCLIERFKPAHVKAIYEVVV